MSKLENFVYLKKKIFFYLFVELYLINIDIYKKELIFLKTIAKNL